MTQKNDFKNANFYGNTQIVNGDVHNVHTQAAAFARLCVKTHVVVNGLNLFLRSTRRQGLYSAVFVYVTLVSLGKNYQLMIGV